MTENTGTPESPKFASYDEALSADDATFSQAFGLPTPEANAPTAPSDVWTDTEVQDLIDRVAAEGAPRARDEQGRFKKDGEEAPAEEATEEAVEVEAEAETEEAPAEEAAEEESPEAEEEPARPLATKFAVVEGDEVKEPGKVADIVLELKMDGKVERLTLDKVARLAQSGKYNEKLHNELDELRPLASRVEELEQAKAADFKMFQQEVAKLLGDDEYLLQRRAEAARRFTPEAEASRLRRELDTVKQQREMEKLQADMEKFVVASVEPKLADILKQYPTISEDELMGRFNRVVLPLQRNGIVPPHQWPRVESLLEGEIGSWAAHLHESRSAERAAVESKSKAEVRKAQVKAQKAKQTLARTVRSPTGGTKSEGERNKPIVSADDAVDDIIGGLARSLVNQ